MKYINQLILLFSLFISCLSHAVWTELYQTIYNGDLEHAQNILDADTTNINTSDEYDFTPLFWATKNLLLQEHPTE
jgi:hypothetical protein